MTTFLEEEGERETLSSYTLYIITYPVLLLTIVKSLVPVLINVFIKFSGITHNPNPIIKSITLLHHNDVIINTYLL